MSIAKKQTLYIANNVIASYLQTGIVPTVNTILSEVSEAFAHRKPGAPQTRFKDFTKQSAIDPAAFNAVTTSAQTDLTLLYQEAIDQVNRLVRAFDYKDTYRRRLGTRALKLEQSLSNITPTPPYTVNNIITNFSDIDILNTTAYVDFDTFTAKLPSVSNTVSIASFSNADIKYTTSGGNAKVISPIHNLNNKSENTAFYVQVKGKEKTASCTVTITLDKPELMSNIDMQLQLSADASIQCKVDGETLSTQTAGIVDTVKWNFTAFKAKEIVLTISKHQPDFMDGHKTGFDFGIVSVLAYYDEFIDTGILQTLPIPFPTLLGSLTLKEKSYTPDNTQIQWQYSYDNGVTFASIIPGQSTGQIAGVTPTYKRVYPVLSTGQNSIVYDVDPVTFMDTTKDDLHMPILGYWRGNCAPLFNICRVPDNYVDSSVTLMRGRNAWRVHSYHYSVDANRGNKLPTIQDAVNPRQGATVYTRWQSMEWALLTQNPGLHQYEYSALRLPAYEYPLTTPGDNVMHVFYARITTSPTITPVQLTGLANLTLTVSNVLSNRKTAIYLNGKIIPVTTAVSQNGKSSSVITTINLPIRKGGNELIIVTDNYTALQGQPFLFGDSVFESLCQYGGPITWYGDNAPMKKVDLYELQYQTSRNDYSRFSVVDDTATDEEVILVRELPTTVYDVSYNLSNDPITETSVILRATMSGDPNDSSITPVVSNFSLVNKF